MTKTAPLTNESSHRSECNGVTDNKTEQLKDILNKVTSLTSVETDVIKALVDLSRGLKIE